MKVLAINSSPRMDKGNTALILTPFLEGMTEAGAEVELFYTSKLEIKHCDGAFTCWLRTPGECHLKDDMQMLYPKLREADIWVLATPVYVDGVTGSMKTLMERTIPLVLPLIELRDGHTRHPPRQGTRYGKVVLVANCGLWEMDNFDPLLVHMKAYCRNLYREFAGALVRPNGVMLGGMMQMGAEVNDIFEAARDAGRQLVRDGKMSPETLDTVSREFMTLEMYVQQLNQGLQMVLDALEKK